MAKSTVNVNGAVSSPRSTLVISAAAADFLRMLHEHGHLEPRKWHHVSFCFAAAGEPPGTYYMDGLTVRTLEKG